MSDWVGFTDAELNKIKSNNEPTTKKKVRGGPKLVKPVDKQTVRASKVKQPTINSKTSERNVQSSSKGSTDLVPKGALFIKPKEKEAELKNTELNSTTKVKPVNMKETPQVKHVEVVEDPIDVQMVLITDDKGVQEKEKQKLEDVHRRQKEMEERNKRKKAMLSKEIAVRKRKALAESSKLQKVQVELAKLDKILSFDVSILRDKIDEACGEYNDAKKRFEIAESEYIASKLDLHKKTVMKEDLTAHLYYLIEANEERKSNKLEELMHALNVEEEEKEEVIVAVASDIELHKQINKNVTESDVSTNGSKTTDLDKLPTSTDSTSEQNATTSTEDNLHGAIDDVPANC